MKELPDPGSIYVNGPRRQTTPRTNSGQSFEQSHEISLYTTNRTAFIFIAGISQTI
jgi:hypothetical protein